ncbi:RIO kinase 1 [Hydrocarboniphaga daqingensis]|uniref:non-specific serine/threonine protein kinase n=1 Tax=Hydrocarboniphaga daqingensis TaxID=490188 RepID=A0A1M5LRR9_9GAMM|nr:PA4780 family RIO1-like protein kinase [Hydrocarboniphaga daqingensis]SHG67666.1 RIO kinase 1 [Hydrocarboniphaga daqingensis]
MKIPKALQPLIEDGIVDRVVRQLKSGKEASVFLVDCGGRIRCAKVYKEAEQRGFQNLAQYQEGRKARGSRDERAMGKRSRHGRKQSQEEWKSAEVDALYRLDAAGVRVPKPYGYYDGVLVMEVIADEHGEAAPRLNDVQPTPEQARQWHEFLIRQIVLMLCAGLIHGDLSEFNVLLGTDGPVIIDLPQAVDASSNNNAFRMLERDVGNMTAYCGRVAPELLTTQYAHEIWHLYQRAELRPDTVLTGCFEHDDTQADVGDVMLHIEEARREAEIRQRGRDEAAAADAAD